MKRETITRMLNGLDDHSGCGLLLNIVQEVKQAVSIPCGGVTYMDPAHAPKMFDDAIAEGKLDFMMMTRSLCCEPEYVNKLREFRYDVKYEREHVWT